MRGSTGCGNLTVYAGVNKVSFFVMPKPISQTQLKQIITACPDRLPRTDALEAQIKIGVGYHNKWYRSQREHWLGWIAYQEYKALEIGKDIESISARDRWRGLNCIPMMFWLAEASGVGGDHLTLAEEVAVVQAERFTCDCPQHGKALREALKWDMVEKASRGMTKASEADADEASRVAYEHLASVKSKYKKLQDRVEAQLQKRESKGVSMSTGTELEFLRIYKDFILYFNLLDTNLGLCLWHCGRYMGSDNPDKWREKSFDKKVKKVMSLVVEHSLESVFATWHKSIQDCRGFRNIVVHGQWRWRESCEKQIRYECLLSSDLGDLTIDEFRSKLVFVKDLLTTFNEIRELLDLACRKSVQQKEG